MAGIGVIFNPLSGSNQRNPRAAQRLGHVLGSHGVVREASSIEELYRIAEDFKKQAIDVLAISGGDGTSGVTVTGFLEVYGDQPLPRIALLRGGTMNTIANSIGLRHGRPEQLLAQLVRGHLARELSPLSEEPRHVVAITTKDARPSVSVHPSMPALSTKYGFLFGAGVVYGFLAEYYATARTPVLAAVTLARTAGSALVRGPMIRRIAEPFRGSMLLDDGICWEERDYFAVAGGTIDHIGLNFRPFYRATERPGTFHVLGIHTSPLGFMAQLDRIWRGRPMRPGHCYDALAKQVVLHASRYPLRYMVDGDLYESEGPLEVAIGPVIRLVVANESSTARR